MRVFVTGATGYIGCWLCKKLVDAGHKVVGLDKGLFPSGVDALPEFAPGVELLLKDMRDVSGDDMAGCDAVCHLGGLSNDPTADFSPEANQAYNVDGTRAVVEAARDAGIKRLTFASSASVYGFFADIGLREDALINPQSNYANSKAEAEQIVFSKPEIGPVVLRQATVGGWSPRMRWDLVVNTMTMCAMRDGVIRVHAGGEAYRPLVDVRDVAEAHVRFLDASGVNGEIFNVAHKRERAGGAIEGYQIGCLALWIKHCLSEVGVECVVEGDWSREEGRSYDIATDKMRMALGWSPPITVGDTVRDLASRTGANWGSSETRNIDWMIMLDHAEKITKRDGRIL